MGQRQAAWAGVIWNQKICKFSLFDFQEQEKLFYEWNRKIICFKKHKPHCSLCVKNITAWARLYPNQRINKCSVFNLQEQHYTCSMNEIE